MSLNKAPFGTWKSPITPESIVQGAIQFKQLIADNNELYWLEARPEEKGRAVFVRAKDQKELFAAPYYARTTVYEYGGKCGEVHQEVLYFTNFSDQHLYSVIPGGSPKPVIAIEGLRFGDFVVHPDGGSIISLIEDHRGEGECKNFIGQIDLKTKKISMIAEGYDFYAFPRLNPKGTKLAYIAWNHPHMMWDQTELFLYDMAHATTKKIAGGREISVTEPRWSPSSELIYVSDQDGFWKLYSENQGLLIDQDADFTYPLWFLGVSKTAFVQVDDQTILVTVATDKGKDHFVCKNQTTQTIYTFDDHPFTFIQDVHALGNQIVFIGQSPTTGQTIYRMDPVSGKYEIIKKSKEKASFSKEYISIPETLEFPTEKDKTAYGFYYPPTNPEYQKEDNHELPPLIVFTHGGPTAHMPPVLNAKIQYWTSRGFGVADVNYGGSSGYGREYRNRLRHAWGIVDVDDCSNAALFLAQQKKVDQDRMVIEGGSAGGYTTLAALTFRKTFKGGTSYFGVSDLLLMTKDTHKYESRYLDSLVGELPEEKDRYIQYSPIYHTDELSSPILLLQGAEDKIVPPNQAEIMYEALVKKGIPTAYLLFEKEQHGFRIAENIIKCLEAQLYFYQKILNIPSTFKSPPIEIKNLTR